MVECLGASSSGYSGIGIGITPDTQEMRARGCLNAFARKEAAGRECDRGRVTLRVEGRRRINNTGLQPK